MGGLRKAWWNLPTTQLGNIIHMAVDGSRNQIWVRVNHARKLGNNDHTYPTFKTWKTLFENCLPAFLPRCMCVHAGIDSSLNNAPYAGRALLSRWATRLSCNWFFYLEKKKTQQIFLFSFHFSVFSFFSNFFVYFFFFFFFLSPTLS